MKKLCLILLFAFSFSFSFGQSWLWGKDGTTVSDTYGLAVDSKGMAYLTGWFQNSISFGSYNLNDYLGIGSYLVKYDTSGNVLWAKQSTQASPANAVAVECITDYLDNIYVVGSFTDTISFGSFTLVASGQRAIFLVKYNSSGNVLWAKQSISHSSGYNNFGNAVVSDKLGNVYITGTFEDTLAFGSFTLRNSLAGADIFTVKYDANGNVLWAKQTTPSSSKNYCEVYSVTCDKNNNIYITGDFADTINFGAINLKDNTSIKYGDVFLVKYDPSGNILWADQSKSYSIGSFSYSVITDKANNVYITGRFSDTIVFGGDTLKGDIAGIFLVKYDSVGKIIWAKQSYAHSAASIGSGYSLSVDLNDRIYFSGFYLDTIYFCKDTFESNIHSWPDPSLILQLDTSGKALCSSMIHTGGDDNNSIACSPSGKYVYLGGDIEDTITFNHDFLNWKGPEIPFIARWHPCISGEIETGESVVGVKLKGISLYPNPNTGKFTLQVTDKESGSKNIEVYNVLGERVFRSAIPSNQVSNLIDLGSQPNGVYLYRVIAENGNLLGEGKIVIEK